MCLRLDKEHSYELVAEDDIIVYKLLTSKEIEENYIKELQEKCVFGGVIEIQKNTLSLMKDDFSLYTPFFLKKIDEDIIEGKRPLVAEGEEIFEGFNERNTYYVSGGYIHVNKNPNRIYDIKYKLFKCVIKKGTRYYDNGVDELAAKEIWFKEEVKSTTHD